MFGILAVEGRMFGRDDIEWKDRSYRLLANKGQIEVDDWNFIGGALGAVFAVKRVRPSATMIQKVVAGTGLGTVAGTLGDMGWRYGVNGGKWPEDR